jgi:hypothetical protein
VTGNFGSERRFYAKGESYLPTKSLTASAFHYTTYQQTSELRTTTSLSAHYMTFSSWAGLHNEPNSKFLNSSCCPARRSICAPGSPCWHSCSPARPRVPLALPRLKRALLRLVEHRLRRRRLTPYLADAHVVHCQARDSGWSEWCGDSAR